MAARVRNASDVDAVLGEARLFEERTREGSIIPDSSRGARQAEHGAPSIGLEREDVLVRPRGARRISDHVLPDERSLLEVCDLAIRVVRRFHGLRVQLDERARLGVAHLRERGPKKSREGVEDLGIAGRRGPRGAQMTDRLRWSSELLLRERGRAHERARARLGASSVRVPLRSAKRDALVVLARRSERGDRASRGALRRPFEAERALNVGDGRFQIAHLLRDGRDRAKLVRERRRRHEAQPRAYAPAAAATHWPLALFQANQVVQDSSVHAASVVGARFAARSRRVTARCVSPSRASRDRGRLEARGGRSARASTSRRRFFVQQEDERGRVSTARDVPHERAANRTHAWVELERPLEGHAAPRPARAELLLQEERALPTMEATRAETAARYRRPPPYGRDAMRARRTSLRTRRACSRASASLPFEPSSVGGRVLRRVETGPPAQCLRRADHVGPLAHRIEQARFFDHELDARRVGRRGFELLLEMGEHRHERAATVILASQERVGRGEIGVHLQRGLGRRSRSARSRLASISVGDGHSHVGARQTDSTSCPLFERGDSCGEEVGQREAVATNRPGRRSFGKGGGGAVDPVPGAAAVGAARRGRGGGAWPRSPGRGARDDS